MGISRQQALDCFRSDDLVGIGMEADTVRRRLHPEGIVTYAIEAEIDLNLYSEDNTTEAIHQEIAASVDRGATCIRLRGIANAGQIEDALRAIRRRFPALWIEALSAREANPLAATLGLGLRETLARLIDAGLDSLATDAFDPTYPGDFAIADWLQVHSAAHALGMRTVAGMVFGGGESSELRVDCLQAIARLQSQTCGFAAFAPIAAAPQNGRELDGVTSVERLKTLAIARMFLDSIDNIQVSATPKALKVLQMGLRFGANDAGTLAHDIAGGEEDVRRIIRDAGFRPAQREFGYRAVMLS